MLRPVLCWGFGADFKSALHSGRLPASVSATRPAARVYAGAAQRLAESRREEWYARVRHLLRAGDIVLLLPEKAEITCPCCGQAMTFFHALRTRARPPPGSTRYGMALPA